jgi:hypothetical protein
MKKNIVEGMLARFPRRGLVAFAAVACIYWIFQIAATYYVSMAQALRHSSWTVAALYLGGFAVLFVLHLLRPWSRAAAILGLLTLALYTGLIWYYTSAILYITYIPSAKWVIAVCTIMGLSGIALDANRCRRLARPDL